MSSSTETCCGRDAATITRSEFLKSAGAAGLGVALLGAGRRAAAAPADRPNVILCMTDDQGWGDVGYYGHKRIQTPVLDEMAASGLRFDRFYAAHPVCSPTRGSVMTGRNPGRYGCFSANYAMRPEELTIAEVMKSAGYSTGHFGKWHLGPVKAGTPVNPGAQGFDEWLSHDNFFEVDPPLTRNGAEPQTFKGEGSEIVVTEALKFIRKSIEAKKPFFTVVWFGSPHVPHVAIERDRAPYKDLPEKQQHYLGEITGVDRAMGTLRRELRALGVADNTLLWFNSDNGGTKAGSTGGLRDFKASLWEGGIRVPGIIEWPARIPKPATTSVPCVTSDIFPTIVDMLGIKVQNPVRPLDGISLRAVIEGKMTERPTPIGFWKYPAGGEGKNEPWMENDLLTGSWRTFRNFKHPNPKTQGFGGHAALVDNRFKLHKLPKTGYELYDLVADPAETKNLAEEKPEIVAAMKPLLERWQASVERSLSGADYR